MKKLFSILLILVLGLSVSSVFAFAEDEAGQPPVVVQGKVYFPDGYVFCDDPQHNYINLDLAVFYLTSQGYGGQVHKQYDYFEKDLQTDANGRRYLPYALRFGDVISYDTEFSFRYYVRDDYGHTLAEDVKYYVMPDGALDDSNQDSIHYGEYDYFYKVGEPVTIDFALRTWDECGPYVVESPHGLRSGSYTATYTYPKDADRIKLTFDPRSYMGIYINGQMYNLKQSNYTVEITGTTAEISVNFYESSYYGFAVTKVQGKTTPTAPAVTDLDAHGTGSDLMKDLKESKTLSAEVYTGGIVAGTAIKGIAALYDESGRFIGLSSASGQSAETGETALEFSFSSVDDTAASVKVMFTGEDLAPAGAAMGSDDME